MRHCVVAGIAAVLLFGGPAIPLGAHAATPEEAKAFSERAAGYIREVGEAKAFSGFHAPRRRLRPG